MSRLPIEVLKVSTPSGALRELMVLFRKVMDGREFLALASQESILRFAGGDAAQLSLEAGEYSAGVLLPIRDGRILQALLADTERVLEGVKAFAEGA